MTADPRTIRFYDTAAERYDTLTHTGRPNDDLRAFMALLPDAARVLDLGCGPGQASVHMAAAGHRPDPVDASRAMVDLARAKGLPARLATFEDLDATEAYDGVWANFSLLHAPRDALPRHLAAIARALTPGGLFHAGMKTGTGEARDSLDRHYTYVTPGDWDELLHAAGFATISASEGVDKGFAGTDDAYLVTLARKA